VVGGRLLDSLGSAALAIAGERLVAGGDVTLTMPGMAVGDAAARRAHPGAR